MVFFDASAERIEEAVFDVALELEGVLVVGALDLLVVEGGDEAAALVLVTEAEEGGDAVWEGVVGLVVELVAVGDGGLFRDEEGGLAGDVITVGSADGDDVAEVLGEAISCGVVAGNGSKIKGDGGADVGVGVLLLALAGDAVADEVVPVAEGTVFEGEAGVDVLIGLLAVGGDAVKVMGLRQTGGGDGVADGEAGLGVGGDVVAEVGDRGGSVEAVAVDGVGAVEAAEGSEVIELVVGSGESDLVAVGVEVAAVAGVVDDRVHGATARGGEVDDGGLGVGAVEGGVAAAIHLEAREAGAGDVAEVEGTAYVVGGDAVDEDFVGGGVAATDKERCDAAPLAGLDGYVAGGLAEIVDDAYTGGEIGLRDEGDGGACLLEGCGDAGRGDGDLCGDGGDFEDDIAGDYVGASAVEILTDGGSEGGG